MRVRPHIASSIALGVVLYYIFKSVPMAISAILSGVLIDLDHVLEGYISFGRKFNIWQTIKIAENCEFRNFYVIMHSYELLFALALLAFIFRPGDVLIGICLGLLLHIIIDSAFNEIRPNAMFFIKRLKAGFKINDLIYVEKQKAKNKSRKK